MTLFIFFAIIWIVSVLWYFSYRNYKKIELDFTWIINNKYSLIKYIFLILSLLTISLTIFGIKTGQEVFSDWKKWIDVVFVLDVSKSMNVADIESNNYIYTRLDFAKKAIADFVTKNIQNRYSLVIFAWDATSSVPLTNDTNFFLSTLNNVDYKNIHTQWTDFLKALSLAHNRLAISEDKSNAIIFISDWWDEWDLYKNWNKDNYNWLKSDKIKYFLAWVWTKNWWKIISWKDVFWRLTYQTYKNEFVISKLNEDNLKDLSWILDWEYQKLDKYSDVSIFNKKIDSIQKKVMDNNAFKDSIDSSRNIWFISFVFFIIYILLYLFEDKIYFLIKKND